MLQTDVEVFGLVGLHAAQGHPRLPDELIMRQLVLVADGHPASKRKREEKLRTDEVCAYLSQEAVGGCTVD